MHTIVGLCLENVVAFDLTAPGQVFMCATHEGEQLYRVAACTPDGEPVGTTTGFDLVPRGGLELLAEAETIVVPAYWALFDPPPAAAFALAHAGLLDGRRATTHWGWADELAARFPKVEVDPAALFVDEGEVMTSAGLSAGIDLALHVVRKDFGAAVGAVAARRMVAPPHREGGQAQFIERPGDAAASPAGEALSLESTRRWALERLGEPLDVAAMARHASVSPRTFARRFRHETGTTPLQWLLSQRVLEARRLLEESDLPVDTIAWRCGFGSAASLRDHFRRAVATTPTAYRGSFRRGSA